MTALFYKLYYPCDRVRDFAYDWLEGKLPALVSMRFRLHLRGCPECREYLKLYRRAADGAEFFQDHPPPQALLDETLAFLARQGVVPPGEPGRPEKDPPR